MVLKTGPNRPV